MNETERLAGQETGTRGDHGNVTLMEFAEILVGSWTSHRMWERGLANSI